MQTYLLRKKTKSPAFRMLKPLNAVRQTKGVVYPSMHFAILPCAKPIEDSNRAEGLAPLCYASPKQMYTTPTPVRTPHPTLTTPLFEIRPDRSRAACTTSSAR
jgi:hypothetical protein